MSRYPEWFIGGPLHGKDRAETHPNVRSSVRVRVPVYPDIRAVAFIDPVSLRVPEFEYEEFVYVPKHAQVFGTAIVVWIGEHEAGDQYQGFDAPQWVRLLGDLILSPHDKDNGTAPVRVDEMARQQRREFETTERIRRRLEQDYRANVNRLRDSLAQHSPTEWISQQKADTGVLQIKIGGATLAERLTDITLYEDHGDEENLPGWIATAQAVDMNTGEDVGYTGYGPDPTSAVMALLADKLNYYGRFVPYGDKGRIR